MRVAVVIMTVVMTVGHPDIVRKGFAKTEEPWKMPEANPQGWSYL